jgi:ketosteroid isomerase-like protein
MQATLSKRQQVIDTEKSFAGTLAARDFLGFCNYVSEEAIFFSDEKPLVGKPAVAQEWKKFFDLPTPPFSWESERVEVLESGMLALSTGPVRNNEGVVFGTFTSIWRLEPDGMWKIIFDIGNPVK